MLWTRQQNMSKLFNCVYTLFVYGYGLDMKKEGKGQNNYEGRTGCFLYKYRVV
jgi:hypothetical protein